MVAFTSVKKGGYGGDEFVVFFKALGDAQLLENAPPPLSKACSSLSTSKP